jgi:DNA-binding transcriptional ArsR family regulator
MVRAMEEVFRALADESRRLLLDRLHERDGQTLTELAAALPSMTRFGVAKHLRVLEDGGLVVTRRAGRSKLHYLNPVPIRLVHDRWISKYAEPWVRTMATLKSALEAGGAEPRTPSHYELYVGAAPEQVREHLTALARSSGVRFELTVVGAACRVVVVDERDRAGEDWAAALSSLKTLLETGRRLDLGAA